MLERLRKRLELYLSLVGVSFARVVPSPTAWTFAGLVVSLLSGLAYSGTPYGGQLVGGLLVLVAGWFDIVDGAVAKATGKASRRGAFLDSTLDRVAEVVIFLGILLGGLGPPPLVLVSLALSLLVSYTRARAESLGSALSGVGIGERSERLLLLAVASILGIVAWGVSVVAIVAGFTFIERTYRGAKSLS